MRTALPTLPSSQGWYIGRALDKETGQNKHKIIQSDVLEFTLLHDAQLPEVYRYYTLSLICHYPTI